MSKAIYPLFLEGGHKNVSTGCVTCTPSSGLDMWRQKMDAVTANNNCNPAIAEHAFVDHQRTATLKAG
ncbi:hypothetical protein DPMN_159660 [Dreissena polymorpha]|uniref:Uncharacterized protein n=1 Tax=Dreissena polymorpha TaxID=45954 RepID=A0A9D4ELE4_DREPO|nr:hypothetical protein DPMN_159660 [Dreissena polymorpha]